MIAETRLGNKFDSILLQIRSDLVTSETKSEIKILWPVKQDLVTVQKNER